jgi:predicted SAM-dependent methyltransferase/2-polyprenyl-3-methyl-5-hydroxy-6-metoxy-1,4-benzoquinol methylase
VTGCSGDMREGTTGRLKPGLDCNSGRSDCSIRLEVGCGKNPRTGFIHCDVSPGAHVEWVCNAWEVPYPSESVDEVYSRHMLEHLTLDQAKRTLAHWYAILKIGGSVDIIVPDLDAHIRQYFEPGDSPHVPFQVSNRDHAMAGFYGWQRDEHDIHKWGYTRQSLPLHLENSGFTDIQILPDESVSGELNLRVTASKRRASIIGPDRASHRMRLRFRNKRLLMTSVLRKVLGNRYETLKKLLTRNNRHSSGGERQVAPRFDLIRADHQGRYIFASSLIKRNQRVLDCACGVGYGSHYLAVHSKPTELTAIDKDADALKYARKHYAHRKIDYRVLDILAPDPEKLIGFYDVVVSFETLEHLDGAKLIGAFGALLKQGGLLILSTPNERALPYNETRFPYHLKHYTPEELVQILTAFGFQIELTCSQHDQHSTAIAVNSDGIYLIVVAKKL